MSAADIAARVIAALEAEAAPATLVSVSFEALSDAAPTRIEARIDRRTRSLAFLSADAFAADGARVAVAHSVHRISA